MDSSEEVRNFATIIHPPLRGLNIFLLPPLRGLDIAVERACCGRTQEVRQVRLSQSKLSTAYN